MSKSFSSLLKKRPIWFSTIGEYSDVIIGSMARVVRNLAGHSFPGWSTKEGRREVAELLLPHIMQLPGNKTQAFCAEMSDLSYAQRRVLLERKQISQCLAARQDGCHIVINGKQDTTFMINEEEHLVMHLYSTQSDHTPLLRRAEKITRELETNLNFAKSYSGEYLTSIPMEAGTGIQLYTILHLPALNTAGMMPQIHRSLEKLMLHISPFFSAMGDDVAGLFALYTPTIPVGAEDEISEHLRSTVLTLAQRELAVRECLDHESQPVALLPDLIGRAYGLLQYAHKLEYKEFMNALSMLRLGAVMGYVCHEGLTLEKYIAYLAQYYTLAGPYHMQEAHGLSETAALNFRVGMARHILMHSELDTSLSPTESLYFV